MTIVTIQERVYRGDNDMRPAAFVFDDVYAAREWLKSIGYEYVEATTYPANQKETWTIRKSYSEKDATVFHDIVDKR